MIFNGILWLASKISEAVDTELTARRENCMVELRELHKALEQKLISEEDFDVREAEILDRLDSIEAMSTPKENL